MYQYPYGNAQQLNLDWLMEQWQEVKQSIDGSLQGEIDRVEAAITDLLNARDAAVAAASAANTSAGAASSSANTAAGQAAIATAQAAAATQERINAANAANNAQTYAGNAQTQATAAANSAGAAYTSASQAAASASDAHDDALAAAGSASDAHNDALAAASAAADAAADALEAEGWAVGEQNGTPVASDSPYYENNAKYYATALHNDTTTSFTFNAGLREYDYTLEAGQLYLVENTTSAGLGFRAYDEQNNLDTLYGTINAGATQLVYTNKKYVKIQSYFNASGTLKITRVAIVKILLDLLEGWFAPFNNTAIAERNYNTNEIVIRGSNILKIKSPIAQGASFTNSNSEWTTIGKLIENILNS